MVSSPDDTPPPTETLPAAHARCSASPSTTFDAPAASVAAGRLRQLVGHDRIGVAQRLNLLVEAGSVQRRLHAVPEQRAERLPLPHTVDQLERPVHAAR